MIGMAMRDQPSKTTPSVAVGLMTSLSTSSRISDLVGKRTTSFLTYLVRKGAIDLGVLVVSAALVNRYSQAVLVIWVDFRLSHHLLSGQGKCQANQLKQ